MYYDLLRFSCIKSVALKTKLQYFSLDRLTSTSPCRRDASSLRPLTRLLREYLRKKTVIIIIIIIINKLRFSEGVLASCY